VAVALLVAAVGACGGGGDRPQWVGKGIHDVGGYVLLAETDCRWPPEDAACRLAVPVASTALDGGDRDRIVSAARAAPPRAWTDGRGGTVMQTTGGWVDQVAIIFRFADGDARAIALFCEPVGTDLGHAPACWLAGRDQDLPRADAPPGP
jgi:hypothetical protein